MELETKDFAMRTIRIPGEAIAKWLANPSGLTISLPVIVDWPELQLTEHQFIANGIALAAGEPEPFPDPSLFAIEIERPSPRELEKETQ